MGSKERSKEPDIYQESRHMNINCSECSRLVRVYLKVTDELVQLNSTLTEAKQTQDEKEVKQLVRQVGARINHRAQLRDFFTAHVTNWHPAPPRNHSKGAAIAN